MITRAPSPRPGMGALPFEGGTTFRVWAPHAAAVFVTGTFDGWATDGTPLAQDGDAVDGWRGTWSADVEGVEPGAEYKFTIRTPDGDVSRIDPYARQVTSSVGNAIVYDHGAFDWGDDEFTMPGWDDIVIYEMHVGTFAATADKRGTFDAAGRRLGYLRELGISAIQVMPPFEFAGDISWGYNPSHLFAIESSYGGPDAFKRFVRDAHAHGIAVIVDVVYNHLGPSDLDLWRFDGWSEHDGGGIYVYNDDRAWTPWGNTRPDFGRGEVRTFLRDSAMTWLEDYRCDGLRFDATVFITAVDGPPKQHRLPEGWSFMAWLNDEIHARQPWKLTIAEDLQRDAALTARTADGGAGFNAQWDAGFIQALRPALTAGNDGDRDIAAVVDAITGEGRGAPLTRVIYTESHDDVANGQVRVPESITPGAADSWWAKKRAALGSVLVLTAPGIPMLFQGQELLEDRWFDDTVALDWAKAHSNDGILRLHRDLIALRRTRDDDGATRGLRGQHVDVLRADADAKIVAFHRWADGGPHDDTVVLANFADRHVTNLRLGLPAPGRWRVRLNSDSAAYALEFGGHEAFDLDADGGPLDGCAQSGLVSVGPYSAIVLSRED